MQLVAEDEKNRAVPPGRTCSWASARNAARRGGREEPTTPLRSALARLIPQCSSSRRTRRTSSRITSRCTTWTRNAARRGGREEHGRSGAGDAERDRPAMQLVAEDEKNVGRYGPVQQHRHRPQCSSSRRTRRTSLVLASRCRPSFARNAARRGGREEPCRAWGDRDRAGRPAMQLVAEDEKNTVKGTLPIAEYIIPAMQLVAEDEKNHHTQTGTRHEPLGPAMQLVAEDEKNLTGRLAANAGKTPQCSSSRRTRRTTPAARDLRRMVDPQCSSSRRTRRTIAASMLLHHAADPAMQLVAEDEKNAGFVRAAVSAGDPRNAARRGGREELVPDGFAVPDLTVARNAARRGGREEHTFQGLRKMPRKGTRNAARRGGREERYTKTIRPPVAYTPQCSSSRRTRRTAPRSYTWCAACDDPQCSSSRRTRRTSAN